MQDERITSSVAITKLDESERRVYGWAHIARKADGSLPHDSQGDVIDTPEALAAWKDACFSFLSDAATADDMHVDFGVAKIVSGQPFDPDLTKALGIPDGILPTGLLITVEIPRTERGDKLWSDVITGKRKMFSIVASVERQEIADGE